MPLPMRPGRGSKLDEQGFGRLDGKVAVGERVALPRRNVGGQPKSLGDVVDQTL